MKIRRKIKKAFIVLTFAVFIYLFFLPVAIVQYGKKDIHYKVEDTPAYDIGIVFGAQVRGNNVPSHMLEDRLITAAELYKAGRIKKILVSGDNRFVWYNEPQTMYNYLKSQMGIPTQDIVVDYAGRRTYDTCIRARDIFGVEKAILITQGYHLPRSIFTCNRVGVKSVGYSSTRRIYVTDSRNKLREIGAIHKALIDVYMFKPKYVGGDRIGIDKMLEE